MPINLEAASSDFDYKNNSLMFRRVRITQGGLVVTAQQASATGLEFENSEWRLQGDVRITVPGGSLQSSEARVQFRNNAIVRASIKGTPAEFEQRLRENDQVARGRAAVDRVQRPAKAPCSLTGDAWLSDGQNEIRGNTLVYDIGRERVQANPNEKDPGGVRITINPPKKTGAAPEQGQRHMSRLRAEALGKSYRSRQVVKNLSLEVASGEVVGLLGPNGAGKTTAFYMIVGLVPCDEGRIHLDDRELTRLPMYRRAQLGVGYLPQEASVFRKLSVEDNILAILETRDDLDDDAARNAALEALLEELHIGHIRGSSGMSLSGGERRRVEIARALAAEPRFILLDEPFAGVDPISVIDIQRIIRHLSRAQHRRADHRPQRA